MKITRSCLLAGLLSAALWLNSPTPVGADTNGGPIGSIISYQGKITNSDGVPVPNGFHSATFTFLENGISTGVPQTMPVYTSGGVFSAFLSPGALSFNPANAYMLSVSFDNGQAVQFPIASVPVAQVAKSANTVADGSITAAKVGPGAVLTEKIADGAVTDAKISAVSAGKVTGQVATTQIADGAVTDGKIADVAAAKVTGQIATAQIADGAVTDAKLAGVSTTKIADGAVTDVKIAGMSTSKLIGPLQTAQIADGAVTDAKIAGLSATKLTGAVATPQIADGAVTDAKISGVATSKITGQIQGSQIANGSIADNHITAVAAAKVLGQIGTGQIAEGAVSASKISGEAWASWTPVAYGSSGSPGAYTQNRTSGRYIQIGKMVIFTGTTRITNVGNWSGYVRLSLPVTPRAPSEDQSLSGYVCAQGANPATGAKALPIIDPTGSLAFIIAVAETGLQWPSVAPNDVVCVSGVYEAA